MSNDENVNGTPEAKKPKLETETSINEGGLNDLTNFQITRVLSESSQKKFISLEGVFEKKDGKALLILEKTPFNKDKIEELLKSQSTLNKEFVNDIYGKYEYFPSILNGIATTVIHPATEKHLKKYESQNLYIIDETPDFYKNITLKHLEEEQFTLEWVYNILDHKSEVDRIAFEDPDPEIGFVLLPDIKWNGKDICNLHFLALVRKRGIKSLRDLDQNYLPLLNNIYKKATNAIETKYKLPSNLLRIYLHYQPSFYHLHIHFTYIKHEASGIFTERAHLLKTVINNIEILPDYYKKATLPFIISESDNLFKRFEENAIVAKVKID